MDTDLSVRGVVSYYGPTDLLATYQHENQERVLGDMAPVPIDAKLEPAKGSKTSSLPWMPPVSSTADWLSQLCRQLTSSFHGLIMPLTCCFHKHPRQFSRRCTIWIDSWHYCLRKDLRENWQFFSLARQSQASLC